MSEELRELLENAVEEQESVASEVTPSEETPPMDSSSETDQNPSTQQTEGTAPSTATEPVDDGPSDKGSVAPSGADDGSKTIEEVVAAGGSESSTPPKPSGPSAPASWTPDTKQLWESLPNEVKQEISRRESQTAAVLQESSRARKQIQEISQVIAPHADRINSLYQGNPVKAIDGLLNVERILTSGNQAAKTQIVARIINDFGVDLKALDSVLAGQELPPEMKQQNQVDQIIEQRLAPVNEMLHKMQQKEAFEARARQQAVHQEIANMAADTTNYPYFEEVRHDMADIIQLSAQRGVAITYKEAYDKAVLMNGRTAQAVGDRNLAQNNTQQALDAHQKAQKAKEASVSVNGNPSSTGPSSLPENVGIRSAITHALENQQGGGRV